MPTGYTAKLMESGQTFPEFVLGCARAFGALVMMRDDPQDAPIPEFKPSDYNAKALAEAVAEVARLRAMTDAEQMAFGDAERTATINRHREWLAREIEQNARLEAMRVQVQAWEPPSGDHVGLKEFMLEQIRISTQDTAYIERMEWRHVDLETRTIRVKAANAKDRDRRIVEMSPNLIEWLRPLARPSGKVLRFPMVKLRTAARGVLGLREWPNDIMRHTFASYHFGEYQNEALAKKQMGHRDDGRVFYNHYCVPVSRADAAKFWGIVPPVALLELPLAA